MSEHRSVSQFREYNRCPQAYYLKRVVRAWERPAAWLPQGTAVHAAAEQWEKSGRLMPLMEAEKVFRLAYAESVDALSEVTPRHDFWMSSGRFKGREDIHRRFDMGLAQVGAYVDYYTRIAPEEVVWTPPGAGPIIEHEFSLDLDGVLVKGFIDLAVYRPKSGLVVRDLKTGTDPGDDFQLVVYVVALQDEFDVSIAGGDYMMIRRTKPTEPFRPKPTRVFDLSAWPRTRLVDEFGLLDESIRAEKFDPKPDKATCTRCPVRAECSFAA
ncbi:PD-(D/E)XK nuclease family protein [Pseudonocardiaceae bacterium YIM PH 21723]|nr:PD-(D/E)XK nuclease family protein [Pseudonocardiaceae bacterium YIM PH 21723]